MEISALVKETWRVNDGMNTVLLEHLSPEMLSIPTPDKAWSVAGYLAHIAGSKKWWLSHLDEEKSDRLPDLYQGTEGNFVAEKDLETIKRVFAQTSRTLLETAERADTKGTLPYASLDLFLLHMTMHDAHHRGQLLLTLRTAGHAPPDEDDFWGGWWPEQGS